MRKHSEIIKERQKKVDLQLEINVLKGERSKLSSEVCQYNEVITTLKEEFKGIANLDDFKEEILNRVKERLKTQNENLFLSNQEIDEMISKKKKELKKLEESSEKALKSKESLSKEHQDIVLRIDLAKEQFNKETKESEKRIVETNNNIASINLELESKKNELNILNKDFDDKKAFILNEEIRISKRAKDLQIYEFRIRKKFAELFPDKEIVL